MGCHQPCVAAWLMSPGWHQQNLQRYTNSVEGSGWHRTSEQLCATEARGLVGIRQKSSCALTRERDQGWVDRAWCYGRVQTSLGVRNENQASQTTIESYAWVDFSSGTRSNARGQVRGRHGVKRVGNGVRGVERAQASCDSRRWSKAGVRVLVARDPRGQVDNLGSNSVESGNFGLVTCGRCRQGICCR